LQYYLIYIIFQFSPPPPPGDGNTGIDAVPIGENIVFDIGMALCIAGLYFLNHYVNFIKNLINPFLLNSKRHINLFVKSLKFKL